MDILPAPLALGSSPPVGMNGKRGLPFMKLKPQQTQSVVICSPIWAGGITHFAAGHMKLCAGDGCPFCTQRHPPRWYAWLHILTAQTHRQFVIQLAAGQHAHLLTYHDTHTTLRGAPARLDRPGKAPNTPLIITFNGPPTIDPALPDPIDLTALLERHMTGSYNHDGQTVHAQTMEAGQTTP